MFCLLYCYPTSQFIQQILNVTKTLKLKTLCVNEDHDLLQIELFQLLFQKIGDYLEVFEFWSFYLLVDDDLKKKLLDSVMRHCTKIKYLDLYGCYVDW